MDEIVAADKRYRTRLFTAYGACLCIVGLLLWLGLPRFLRYLDALPLPAFLNVTEICVVTFLLAFIFPAAYLVYIGRKIVRLRQMPYPGMKVIHDTKVLTGDKAAVRGWMLLILGICGICMALAGVASSHYFFEKFRHFNPFRTAVVIIEIPREKLRDQRSTFLLSFAAPEPHIRIRAGCL